MCEDDLKFAFWKLRAHLPLCMHIGYAGNNVEHRRDKSWFDFFQGISFRVFSEISCFLTILYGTKLQYIVCDKRTSPPYKNRSHIHKTSDSLRWKVLSALCKKTSDKECVQFFPVSPPTRNFSCAAFKRFSYFWRQCCVCSSVLIYNFRNTPDDDRKQ